MKTKLDFGSSIAGIGDQSKTGRPIPGPERPLESRGAQKPDEGTPKSKERVLSDSERVYGVVSGMLSGVIPEKHLPMAVEDFKKKFPGVTDVAQVKGDEFFDWVDTLPLAHTVKGIKIV